MSSMIASCAARKYSRAFRSRIAKSGFAFFQRETVEGCRHIPAAAALSEAPVRRMTSHSASAMRAVSWVGRPGWVFGSGGADGTDETGAADTADGGANKWVFIEPNLYHGVFGPGGL